MNFKYFFFRIKFKKRKENFSGEQDRIGLYLKFFKLSYLYFINLF